jgi:hypothetical protein
VVLDEFLVTESGQVVKCMKELKIATIKLEAVK